LARSLPRDDPPARRSAQREGSRARTAPAGRRDPARPAPEESPAAAPSQPGPRSGTPPPPTANHPFLAGHRRRQIAAQHHPESHAPACSLGDARRSPWSHWPGPALRPERPTGPGTASCAVARAGPLVRAAQRRHLTRARHFWNACARQAAVLRSWAAECTRAAGRSWAAGYSPVTGCTRMTRRSPVTRCIRVTWRSRAAGRNPAAGWLTGRALVVPRPEASLRRAVAPSAADVATVAPAGCPAAGRRPHHPDSPCRERSVPGGEARAGPVYQCRSGHLPARQRRGNVPAPLRSLCRSPPGPVSSSERPLARLHARGARSAGLVTRRQKRRTPVPGGCPGYGSKIAPPREGL
jgi:hypothetical protein